MNETENTEMALNDYMGGSEINNYNEESNISNNN